MLVSVEAVLWRAANTATLATLNDESKGQYHIELLAEQGTAPDHPIGQDFRRFFGDLLGAPVNKKGRLNFNVPVEAVGGSEPVPAQPLPMYYLGEGTARSSWNIPSQRSDTAYPLWRPERACPSGLPGSDKDALLLIRDTKQRYHARWLRSADRGALPDGLRAAMKASPKRGVWEAAHSAPAAPADADTAVRTLHDTLRRDRCVLLQGPPGTGKSHLMQEVARVFQSAPTGPMLDTDRAERPFTLQRPPLVRWVTFHQSFGYEDFVVGLRPDPDSTAMLSLRPVPGVLLEATEHARQPGGEALVLIDEINRGNVSRILGELITLLEPDKRLDAARRPTPRTVSVRLPYATPAQPVTVTLPDGTVATVPSPFTMPLQVYVLASMNSVDKSVAPLDSALRRRFTVQHVGPSTDQLAEVLGITRPDAPLPATLSQPEEAAAVALSALDTLNQGIAHLLGPEFQLGQWYLSGLQGAMGSLEDARAALAEAWTLRLLPQLLDLFAGRQDQLVALLWGDAPPHSSDPLTYTEPPPHLIEHGAMPLLSPRPDATSHDTLAFLRRLSGL